MPVINSIGRSSRHSGNRAPDGNSSSKRKLSCTIKPHDASVILQAGREVGEDLEGHGAVWDKLHVHPQITRALIPLNSPHPG